MSENDNYPSVSRPGSGIVERLNFVWAAVFYLTLIVGVSSAVGDRPDLLRSWAGAGTIGLALLSLTLFQTLYLPFFRFERGAWPMPPARAALYFSAQFLTLALLFALDRNFLGLGFALLGQTMGALHARRWPLPLIVFALLTGWPIGLYDDLSPRTPLDLIGYFFLVGIFVVLGLLMAGLFEQRYRLTHLVGELRQAKAAAEASAAQQEELAVLRERTRLAREMHDSLGHALVLVNVKLEAAQRLYRVAPERGDAELEAVRGLVRETMAGLRHSLHDLRAPVAPFHDLPAGLRRLCAEVSARSGLSVVARCDEAPPPALAEPLWWIAREALANIERHARASHAAVELRRDGQGWLLLVSDDGVGVRQTDLRRPGHFGLLGMRERAEAVGGSLAVRRNPSGGTLVEAYLPASMV